MHKKCKGMLKMLSAFLLLGSGMAPIQAEESPDPISSFPAEQSQEQTLEQNEHMLIRADGIGTIRIVRSDGSEEVLSVSDEVPLDTEIAGAMDEEIAIYAEGDEGLVTAMWGMFNSDGSTKTIGDGMAVSEEASVVFGHTKMMQLSFATKEQSQAFHYGTLPRRRRLARALAPSSFANAKQGDTFTGRLTLSNEDIYANRFHVSWLDGGLAEISHLFTNGEIMLHCLNPGGIGPTKDISVYGMYAPVYHTYHAEITRLDRSTGTIAISMYTDPLLSPRGRPLTGYNNGVTVNYQTVGRTVQYGGEIELTMPEGSAEVVKKDPSGAGVAGARLGLFQNDRLIEEWISDGSVHAVKTAPGTYELRELEVPRGYIKAKPVTVVVNAGQTASCQMKDGRLKVVKTDAVTGEMLIGAVFEVRRQDGSVADRWTSDGSDHWVENLEEGNRYTLVETSAPQGYQSASPVSFTAACDKEIVIPVANQPKRIRVSFSKQDRYDSSVKLAGAEFTLFHENGTVATMTNGQPARVLTDENGNCSFELYYHPSYTSFYAMETRAPDGYLVDNGARIELGSALERIDHPVHKVLTNTADTSIQIHKVDAIAGRAQGDATLAGAIYDVYDAKTNQKIDARITGTNQFVIKADGSSNIIRGLPFDRDYYAIEAKAPEGYLLFKEKIMLSLSKTVKVGNRRSIDAQAKENPVSGKLGIYKHYNKKPGSEIDNKPEEGAVFAVVLKKYVEQYGSVSEAIQHKDQFAAMEYDIMTTGKDGRAASKDLAYGTYLAAQIHAVDQEAEICRDVYEFRISGTQNNPIQQVSFTNDEKEYALQLIKTDGKTGRHITYRSAAFKIKQIQDGSGKPMNVYVTQKVGLRTVDTFRTASSQLFLPTGTIYASYEEKGTVTTPLKVKAGIYLIEEVETPAGFVKTSPLRIEVKASGISEIKEDGTQIVRREIVNQPVYGRLHLRKKLEEIKSDVSLVKPQDLSKVRFGLYAADTIIDPADGSILLHKGEQFSSFYLNSDGTYLLDQIPLGSYDLKELEAPAGILLEKKSFPIVISQTDETTEIYDVQLQVTNQLTYLEIVKEDMDGKVLTGAKLSLRRASDHQEIAAWVSGRDPFVITGLDPQETYILYELEAPEGYVRLKEFDVSQPGTPGRHRLAVKNTQVTISKEDLGGQEVKDAHMSVIEKDTGKTVDAWISDGSSHAIIKLEEGKEYILHENLAPAGYAKANDIPFTPGKENLHLSMKDVETTIEKIDDEGSPLSGVTFEIMDEEGNVVDTLISDGTEQKLSNLTVGKTYTLKETAGLNGYYGIKEKVFTVEKENDLHLEIVNAKIRYDVEKIDDEGRPVIGAVLQLYEQETGELLESWETANENHRIQTALQAGKDYRIHEEKIINGVYRASDLLFHVETEGTGEPICLQVVDAVAPVEIRKCDENGNLLAGAKLAVMEIDDDGSEKEAVRFETDVHNAFDLTSYVSTEKKYVLRELEAPKGYLKAQEIPFVVMGTKENPQVIVMTDALEPRIPVTTGISSHTAWRILMAGACAVLAVVFVTKRLH